MKICLFTNKWGSKSAYSLEGTPYEDIDPYDTEEMIELHGYISRHRGVQGTFHECSVEVIDTDYLLEL